MSTRGAVWGALCSSAAFALLAAGVVSGRTQHADLMVRAAVHAWDSPALTSVMMFFTRWGAPREDAVVVVIAAIVFILKRHPEVAVWLACAFGGAAFLRHTLALAFHRPRPLPFFAPEPFNYSFPSGHAVFSACVYGVLASFAGAGMSNRTARFGIWIAAVLWVLAIGFSRIYLGFHYPTDVLAGFAIGFAWTSALVLAAHWFSFGPTESAARRVPAGR